MTETPPSVLLHFREVNPETWPELERLFESRGGPKNCWCMVWRATSAEARQSDSPSRKAALKHRVDENTPIGILGYQGNEPVAWCSIAPRPTYLRLGGLQVEAQENVWSLVCFFVVRRLRGQGIIRQLISAAAAFAKINGAAILEAYPVDPHSPSYRFMGFIASFKEAGFSEVGLAGTQRHIMRLRIQ